MARRTIGLLRELVHPMRTVAGAENQALIGKKCSVLVLSIDVRVAVRTHRRARWHDFAAPVTATTPYLGAFLHVAHFRHRVNRNEDACRRGEDHLCHWGYRLLVHRASQPRACR